jgi:hypothetical protein
MILGALALSLLFASAALAVGSHSISRWVIGSGGGSMTAGNTSLDSTVGQWVVGGSVQLGSGFWGGGRDESESYVTYLPVALRDFP